MIINIKDVLTLDDDKEYVVVSKAPYNKKIYYYLIDKNDQSNVLFCYQDNDELVEVRNKDLIMKLTPLFLRLSIKELDQ